MQPRAPPIGAWCLHKGHSSAPAHPCVAPGRGCPPKSSEMGKLWVLLLLAGLVCSLAAAGESGRSPRGHGVALGTSLVGCRMGSGLESRGCPVNRGGSRRPAEVGDAVSLPPAAPVNEPSSPASCEWWLPRVPRGGWWQGCEADVWDPSPRPRGMADLWGFPLVLKVGSLLVGEGAPAPLSHPQGSG